MKKIIIIALIAILAVLAAFKLMNNKKKVQAQIYKSDPNKAFSVKTQKVESRLLAGNQTYLGAFEPARENKIAAETQGRVVRVGVNEGDFVKKGQLIAKVDDEMLHIQLEGLKVSLDGQQKDVTRYTNLSKTDAVPGVQLEKAELGTRGMQVQIKQVNKQIANTNIYAPFSGIVTMRMFDMGSVLAPGLPLVQLTDISNLKLAINVPENDLMSFKVGQSVTVTTDVYPAVNFSGKVVELASKGDASHNFTVKILINNTGKNQLRAGMYGSVVKQNTLVNNTLTIPKNALIGSTKDAKVYVVENGKAVLKSFSAGVITDEYIQVVSGLSANDEVVVTGQVNLENGVNVTIKN